MFDMDFSSMTSSADSRFSYSNSNAIDEYNDFTSPRSLSHHSNSGSTRYCTPRTLLTLEAVNALPDNIVISTTSNHNIWSSEYKPSTVESLVAANRPTTTNAAQYDTSSNSQSFRGNPSINTAYTMAYVSGYSPDVSPTSDYQNSATSQSDYYNGDFASASISPTLTYTRNNSPRQNKILTFRSYKGNVFTVPPNSRFFVIKSYSILDVNASFIHNIWTSTELGNKRLSKAYNETKYQQGKIFLFFSVNSSGKFCGVAEMSSEIDFTKSSDIWVEQTRWKGIFPVEWLLIKDIPNRYFHHLKVPSNEFKPVTNSRDTQEIPYSAGISMLKIISSFVPK